MSVPSTPTKPIRKRKGGTPKRSKFLNNPNKKGPGQPGGSGNPPQQQKKVFHPLFHVSYFSHFNLRMCSHIILSPQAYCYKQEQKPAIETVWFYCVQKDASGRLLRDFNTSALFPKNNSYGLSHTQQTGWTKTILNFRGQFAQTCQTMGPGKMYAFEGMCNQTSSIS